MTQDHQNNDHEQAQTDEDQQEAELRQLVLAALQGLEPAHARSILQDVMVMLETA